MQHAPEAPSLTAINLHILKNLWLPDVEILDLKSFETHSVLSKLEGTEFKTQSFCFLKIKILSFCAYLKHFLTQFILAFITQNNEVRFCGGKKFL
jgi:hypothetical protein